MNPLTMICKRRYQKATNILSKIDYVGNLALGQDFYLLIGRDQIVIFEYNSQYIKNASSKFANAFAEN